MKVCLVRAGQLQEACLLVLALHDLFSLILDYFFAQKAKPSLHLCPLRGNNRTWRRRDCNSRTRRRRRCNCLGKHGNKSSIDLPAISLRMQTLHTSTKQQLASRVWVVVLNMMLNRFPRSTSLFTERETLTTHKHLILLKDKVAVRRKHDFLVKFTRLLNLGRRKTLLQSSPLKLLCARELALSLVVVAALRVFFNRFEARQQNCTRLQAL